MSDPNNLVYREQLDDNVIDMLSEDIGSNYSLRTENTKTIASALNEIRGKDIIANAVGDPLLSTDSYSDMGSKIRQMTNEFKTQLINKGVTISSYDKLNSLINKINEIVGDGNSGIQVATGIVNSNNSSEWFARTSSGRINAYRVESSNLSFKPNLVIIYYNDGTNNKINSIGFGDTREFIYNNISGVTSSSDTWYAGMLEPNYNDSASGTSGTIIPKFNDNGFLFYTGIPSTEFTYLAYGLGESQTDALTESLKQVLIENGIEVNGNETMAELIVKVDTTLIEKDAVIENLNNKNEENENSELQLYTLLKNVGYNVSNDNSISDMCNILEDMSLSPVNVKYVACGEQNTFVVKNDGSLWACGCNTAGRLGLGSTNTSSHSLFCKVINEGVKQVSSGPNHTMVLKDDGSLWACGNNEYGDLGLGDTEKREVFTQVTDNVKQVSCGGDNHTFILKNDGSLWSCGVNDKGQLGLGDTTNRATFNQVTTNVNNDVKQIACGGYIYSTSYNGFTFIIKNDGSLWACGCNYVGCLGQNVRTTGKAVNTFTQVTENINNDVEQVSCGTKHVFIIKNDGSLWACGCNDQGQLGINGDNGDDKKIFVHVTENISNGVKQVDCGKYSSDYAHTIILQSDNCIACCGANIYGELGINTNGVNKNSIVFTRIYGFNI